MKRAIIPALALALSSLAIIPPAQAAPATYVYFDGKSCKATTALNPAVPDYTNAVEISYTRPDRIGSGRGVYLKGISWLPGNNRAKARVTITSHETPRYERTWQYNQTNRRYKDVPTPPESSRRNVTRIRVRVTNLTADGRHEHTACTVPFDK